MDSYDDKSPKEALGMFRSRTRRAWGHATAFAWSDLILDRSCKLVGLQSLVACATRAGGDSDQTSKTTTSSTPSPQTQGTVLTPVRGEQTGMSTSGISFLGSV